MKREEICELHNIVSHENFASILKYGILSHHRAARIPHHSIAMPEIQAKRSNVTVPGGRPLHEYANLYINARNKMMYKIRSRVGCGGICVLRVDHRVLDLPKVVIADQNASSGYVFFRPSPVGLQYLSSERIYSQSWKHPEDQIDEWRHGAEMCAEVLVPDLVPQEFLTGVYVSSAQARESLAAHAEIPFDISVNGHLFFQ